MGNCRARDVLSYVGWVESLLIREAVRCDPEVAWPPDLSWDEMAACVGVEMPSPLRPGDAPANVELGWQLYWPGGPPSA